MPRYTDYGSVQVYRRKNTEEIHATIRIDGERTVFGKSEDCDIRVKRPDVSDKQAEIVFENGKFFLVNHASTNPTIHNGEKIDGKVELQNNTFFEIAGRSFKWIENLVLAPETPKKVSLSKENVAFNANRSASKIPASTSRIPFKAIKHSAAPKPLSFATPAAKSSKSVLQRSTSQPVTAETKIPKREPLVKPSVAVTPKKAASVPSAPSTPRASLMPSLTPKKVATPKVAAATPKVASTPRVAATPKSTATPAASTPKSVARVAAVERVSTPVTKTPVHIHFASPAQTEAESVETVSTPVKHLAFDEEEPREATQEASPSLNEEREEEEEESDDQGIPEERPEIQTTGRASFTLLEDENDTIVVTPKKQVVAFAPSPVVSRPNHVRSRSSDLTAEKKKEKQTALNALATPAKKKSKKKNVKKVPIAVTVAKTPAKTPSKSVRSEVNEKGETFVVGVEGKEEETEEIENEVEVLGLATPVKAQTNNHKRFTTPTKDEISSRASRATESYVLSAVTPRAKSLRSLPEPEAIDENANRVPSAATTPKVARTPKTKEAVNDSEGNTFDFLSTKRSLFTEEGTSVRQDREEEEEEEEEDGFHSASEGESPAKSVEATVQSARVERSVAVVKNATPKLVKATVGSAKAEKSRGVIARTGLATPQRKEIQSKATAMSNNRAVLPSQKMGTPMRKAIQTAQLKPAQVEVTKVSSPAPVSARTTPVSTPLKNKTQTPVSTPLKSVAVEEEEVDIVSEAPAVEETETEVPVEEAQVAEVKAVEPVEEEDEVEEESEEAEAVEEEAEEESAEVEEAEVESEVAEAEEQEEAEEVEEEEEMTAEQMNAHFEEIWEALREEKDSEGERLSKKLLRLPSSKAKANKVYFEVVQDPIDLQMIKKSIGNGDYETVEAFRADFDKLFDNAILFNEHKPCDENLANVQALRKLFEEQMKERFGENAEESEAEEAEEEAEEVEEAEEETEEAEEEEVEAEEAEEAEVEEEAEEATEEVEESAEESEVEEEKVPTPQPVKKGRKKTIVQEAQMEESDEQVFSSPRTRRNNRKKQQQQQKSKLAQKVEEEEEVAEEGSGEEAEEETVEAEVEEAEEEEKESLEAAITRLSELRVVDLRAELKKRGLPTGGLKAELVRRLAEAESQ